MTRRVPDGESGFGSDSFLDIVANIVGILIILIVVAGLRASRAPVTVHPDELLNLQQSAAATPEHAPGSSRAAAVTWSDRSDKSDKSDRSDRSDKSDSSGHSDAKVADSAEPDDPDPTRPTASVEALHEPPESRHQPVPKARPDIVEVTESPPVPHILLPMLRHAEELNAKIQQLRDSVNGLVQMDQATAKEADRVRQQLSDIEDRLSETDRKGSSRQVRLTRSQQTYAQVRAKLAALQAEVTRVESEQPEAQPVEHKVTPISHSVEGQELHFRLSGNRVAVVPLDELLERLKTQIQRQRDWLLRYRRHEGQVGPVDGFVLNYVVERQAVSVFEELEHGRGMVRVGVSRWELEAQDGLVAEEAGTALRPDSRFQTALFLAPAGTTMTFWVYPDSYGLYRRLQKLAQDDGFTVAARPLPFGVPIAGSPFGTRSSGQ